MNAELLIIKKIHSIVFQNNPATNLWRKKRNSSLGFILLSLLFSLNKGSYTWLLLKVGPVWKSQGLIIIVAGQNISIHVQS